MKDKDFLYKLLPRFIRYSDAYQGEPLRALFEVLQGPFEVIRKDLSVLYRNAFIETCEPWAIPYIGDLLGVRSLIDPKHFLFSQRTQVANTIAYRRRKGTAATLARVAQDATGWYSHVFAGADAVAMTASLRFPRPVPSRTLDLENADALNDLGNPFHPARRTVVVRCPAPEPGGEPASVSADGPGLFNLSNLALYLWRLQAYPLEDGGARAMKDVGQPQEPGDPGAPLYYTFSPYGVDRPLFNLPRTPSDLYALAGEESVPGPLSRRALAVETEALARNQEPPTRYLAPPPAFAVCLWYESDEQEPPPVPARDILVCDLSSGRVPPSDRPFQVAVDPELGRLALSPDLAVQRVIVSASYGFSADVGGGPYCRRDTLSQPSPGTWEAVVSCQTHHKVEIPSHPDSPSQALLYDSLSGALADWKSGPEALVRILDNGIYVSDEPVAVDLAPDGKRQLVLEAADGGCPCLIFRKGLVLRGPLLAPGQKERLRVELNGLWIEGPVSVSGDIDLEIVHCTLRPTPGSPAGAPVLDASAGGPEARLSLSFSLTGPLSVARNLGGFTVHDSLVDGGSGKAIDGPPAVLERCTIFGSVSVERLLLAEDVLFTAPVQVRHRWTGEVRNSYVPRGSHVPPTVRCQPDAQDGGGPPLCPAFVSQRFGDPGYGQLASSCSREISAGGTDGSEMGVFHSLGQPYRQAQLPAILAEYVPWGFSTRIVYVT
ncbi:MAG TPA: hypothetical protein VJ725_01445 [Thermoanaerobaculia bacterium]|nr:hypothetical protein [Thermoanaerobaculia bacterium]